jgi:outer membrane lipoprotein carrier protein
MGCGVDKGDPSPAADASALPGTPAPAVAPGTQGDPLPVAGPDNPRIDTAGGTPGAGLPPVGGMPLPEPGTPQPTPPGAVDPRDIPDSPGITAPSGQDATAILTRAAERLAGLNSFCGDFRQEIRIPLLGQTTRSAGRLCQQRPNLFAMDFTDPQGDRVVADGQWVWTYFPSTDPRQVVRFPLAEQGRMDFFQEFVAEPGVRYVPNLSGEEVVGGRPAWRITLTPRDRTYFEGATVWIDRETALMRKVEILQENGSIRIVELGELQQNPSIPASRFSFTPPEGTQVFTPPPPGGGA